MPVQTYKFAAGQTVVFVPGSDERKYGGLFEVVRRLPEEHGQHQYRIRSRSDGHQRVVWEYQLTPGPR